MAFKKRQNIEQESVSKNGIFIKSGSDEHSDSTSKSSKKESLPEFVDYRQEAIHTLNLLEKKGINIYDETRTPGMYLNGNKSPSKKIANFLGSSDSDVQNDHGITKNLFNFLSKT